MFIVSTPEATWHARRVLLATGSSPRSHTWLTALGHQLIPSVPSLFTFHVRDKALTELSGLSFPFVRAKLKVEGQKPLLQEGPLLITHWGLSGPVVLRLSAWGARILAESQYQAQLLCDIAPEHAADEIYVACMARKKEKSGKFIVNDSPLSVPKRFWEYFLQRLGLPLEARWLEISDKQCRRLAETCKALDFQISGKSVFKEEFVTAGGVPLNEVELKTMQSRLCPQLYLVGEVLDVDAVTGGFNFQNAWSTGYIAGCAIAESISES